MQIRGKLLFVDDEGSMRDLMQIALEKDGHEVDTAPDGDSALALFRNRRYDMVIHDLKMPGMGGIELLRRLREENPAVPVVVLTAFSTWDTAVEAMRLGAYDYLKKPFDNDEVRALVQRALSLKEMRENPADTAQMRLVSELQLVGCSPAMQEIMAMVRRVACTDSTVVITGESGTGKEVVARMLHLQSHRRDRPFIGVNCGAFSETLLESEIFGHVRGAFTGAVSDKRGLLEIAEGGTFFLDEAGEMSPSAQVRLLRALETREYLPVGGAKARRADVRFIAATNRDLNAMVEEGAFREDLFYRLNVIPLRLPPLRERREDIPLLAGHFLAACSRACGRKMSGIDDAAVRRLMDYDWPGNVRELQNTIQRAVTLARADHLTAEDIVPARQSGAVRRPDETGAEVAAAEELVALGENGLNLDETLSEIEARYIAAALEKTGGNLTRAAELLGISFRSMRYKVKKLGLDRKI